MDKMFRRTEKSQYKHPGWLSAALRAGNWAFRNAADSRYEFSGRMVFPVTVLLTCLLLTACSFHREDSANSVQSPSKSEEFSAAVFYYDYSDSFISELRADLTEGLVKVTNVNTGTANIAGVAIPTFGSVDTEVKPIDPWATPAWLDSAVETAKQILSLQCERAVYEEQRRLVQEELQTTSQRVNLFEKIKIPECKEAIRVIKISLGDEQTAAVTRGKIAKGRDKS